MANMPLTDIGITPRKASQFASKGIETVTDLLGYYPTKYLDFRNPISFAEGKYHQGEHVAIKGKVVSGRVIDGKHYMLRLTDGNTFCTVFWFNQPFRTRQFSVGDVIALGGVVSWNEQYNNMTMATPDFVTTDIASAFSIQFDAVSISSNLRNQGGAVPGYRPGPQTTEMLNKALHKMAQTGSFYLAIIALMPMVLSLISGTQISFGGTSLMIMSSVALEVVRSMEGYLTVRHHKGFLG